MKLRISTLHKYAGVTGDTRILGRIEVCWSGEQEEWFTLSFANYDEHDWCLLVLSICLGARRARIPFEYVSEPRNLQGEGECAKPVSELNATS